MSLTGQVLRLHQAIYERTDGRIGHRTIGVPTLLLRTTGRRTGATRTNALVYARDGDAYLVVAPNAGAGGPGGGVRLLRSEVAPALRDYGRPPLSLTNAPQAGFAAPLAVKRPVWKTQPSASPGPSAWSRRANQATSPILWLVRRAIS